MDSNLLIKLQTEKAQRFLQEADDMVLQKLSHDFVKAVGGLVNITNV